MLVLSRKSSESVEIGGADGCQRVLKVTVLEIRGGTVKLGFEADADVPRSYPAIGGVGTDSHGRPTEPPGVWGHGASSTLTS